LTVGLQNGINSTHIENDYQYHEPAKRPASRGNAQKASRKDGNMLKRTRTIVFTAVTLLLVWATAALADQKGYVWTYDYSTLARESTEMELYQTAATRDRKTSDTSDWTQQIEIEYGVTDRLDAALYQVFEQPASGAFTYEGFKLRLRYRIAEKDRLPVDVLLYAEHLESTSEDSEFEGKLVLAKDFGKWNIAYNQIFEQKYEGGSSAENAYAAGISYEMTPAFGLGVESKGNFRDRTYAAGPTLSWSGGRIWANIGAVFGLNNKTMDREARLLMGIPF
jgi:hypothetical protein